MSLARPLLLYSASLMLLGCATAASGFSTATLAFVEGQEALTKGDLDAAAQRHRDGIDATRKLVSDFPEDSLVQKVVQGSARVGPYSYTTIQSRLASRVELWLKHEQSLLARAFLEAQSVSVGEARVELLARIAVAMAESEQAGPATVVIGAAEEDLDSIFDPAAAMWARLNIARARTAVGETEKALEDLWAVLDELESDPPIPGELLADMLYELLDWCSTIEDNAVALPILQRIADAAAMLGLEEGADLIIESAAFDMAARGDCMAAQITSEGLLYLNQDDPYLCDCESDDYASTDERDRLELLFDIFDECSEADPDSALVLLAEAAAEAHELGWSQFLSDVAWGFASLNEYEDALEAARSIPDALARIDALLAVVEELPDASADDDDSPDALSLLHEAADIALVDADAASQTRYRATLSVALAAAGDLTRAGEQARLALGLVQKMPLADQAVSSLALIPLGQQFSDEEKDTLVKIAIAGAEAQTLLPARLQGLLSAFDGWLAVGDIARARELLKRATAYAEDSKDLEDEQFWCDAVVGFAATGAPTESVLLLDRLSPSARHWCLVSLAGNGDMRALESELQSLVEAELEKAPDEAELSAAEANEYPPELPCRKALEEGLRDAATGADRVRVLLDLTPRCESQGTPNR